MNIAQHTDRCAFVFMIADELFVRVGLLLSRDVPQPQKMAHSELY